MRYNSVMDEDEEEEEPEEEKWLKRKEPDHRRQNRMRQESVSFTFSNCKNLLNFGGGGANSQLIVEDNK